MSSYIGNLPATDDYDDPGALTLGPDFSATKATVTVANNPALVQVAIGVPGDWRWTDESEYLAIPKEFPITGIIGVRFRNANAGQVAQIICNLTGPADPDFGAGIPMQATVTPTGGVSAGVTVTTISATGAGNFALPVGPKTLRGICVGAAGGGSGGLKSNNAGSNGMGGNGGGGGAATVIDYLIAELLALYPSGLVPYSVGAHGAGGNGGVNGAATKGGDGGATTFGTQSAGGGGGGQVVSGSASAGGAGGGITSAVGVTQGQPRNAVNTPGVGTQSGGTGTGTFPLCAEYGGAAGASQNYNTSSGSNMPGEQGGDSLYGGAGGGSGGGWGQTALGVTAKGGKGGLSGSYRTINNTSGNGTGAAGTQTGPYACSGGDGGNGASSSSGAASNGQAGGTPGGGGGGGGGSGTGAAGNGGNGGDGQIVIIAF